jgi:hypothetical protein
MRRPVKDSDETRLRAARPTPTYNDEVSEDFIARQRAHIESRHRAGFELTPVTGDAW